MDRAGAPPLTLRERLLSEHTRLEALLERVIAATERRDDPSAAEAWHAFTGAVRAQIDAEDALLVSLLPHGRDARILSHEHRYLRGRLGELAEAGFRDRRTGTLTDLRDILRAHARNDDRLLYRWAEEELDVAQRTAVLDAVAARLARLAP